jgi:hypothetical protein
MQLSTWTQMDANLGNWLLILTGLFAAASFGIAARDRLFFSLIRCLQLEHGAQELSDPFAFLSHLIRPVPAPVVAVLAAPRSSRAKATM